MKICIACGMPMEKPEDYPGGDTQKDYCVYCAGPDGQMQSFDEKKAGMIAFLIRTQGLDPAAAEKVVIADMKNLPAWSGHFE